MNAFTNRKRSRMMRTVVRVCLLKRLPNATWPVVHGPFFGN
jgi:hypothetical protein